MDTVATKKWLGVISDIFSLFGLRQWLAPPILAGVAVVLGLINNAPTLFFVAIIAIIIVACSTNVALAVIKYKRWLRLSLSEDEHLVKILNCLRQLHRHTKQVSTSITESDTNRDDIPDEAEHFLDNLGISIDKAIEGLPHKQSTNYIGKYVEKITSIKLRNQKQVLDKTNEADIVLKSSLFVALENDAEYGKLKSELYGYVSELAVSNDKIIEAIDGNVSYSRIVFSGMLFERRLISHYGLPDDNYKRNERLRESAFNKELEKVRRSVRTAIMKGV